MSFGYEKKYQIPVTDLKNDLDSFLKQESLFVLAYICLKNFWKVIHKTKSKDDTLGENRVGGRQ